MRSAFQLILDLFDEPGPVQAPDVAAPTAPAAQAPVPPDPRPALTLQQAVAPMSMRHPQANREALLGNVLVGYHFRRGRRRNIGFSVGPEGLTVSAPRWVPLAEVDAALREKSRWITGKLAQVQDRAERIAAARIDWKDGATFPYLGDDVVVVLDPRHAFKESGAVLNDSGDALDGIARLALHVGLADNASAQQVRDAVQAWLMREARRVFTERLDHFAPRLGVEWRKLSLSSASTLWGTARHDGSIRLNWRLIHFRMPVIDYVVAHELSHLRVMDHSPRFWDTVRSVVPDFHELRGQLKGEHLPPW